MKQTLSTKRTLRHLATTLALAALVLFAPTGLRAQTTVTIGTGTVTSNTNPIGTYYNYSITEQLYTEEEIGMAGNITSISFYYMGTAAKDLPITVYMENVSATDLSSGGLSLANATQVFSGTLSVPATAGWVSITLNTPFPYDGTSNLLIGINKDYLYYFSGQTWQGTATPTTMARYTQNDYDAYTTATTPGSGQSNRPNIQLTITPSSGPTCERPADLTVSNITTTGATFSWTSTVGNYVFEYKAASADTWTTLPLTSNTTTLTNLQPGTSYNARVKAVCEGGLESGYRTANFMTVYGVPFSESFSTSSVPANWNRYTGLLSEILGGTSTLASTTNGWSFGNYNGVFDNHTRLNIYGTTYRYWLVTPTMSIGNNVQLTFDLALTAYSGTVAAPSTTGTDDKFVVLITTDDGTTWTVLRQWDNAGSSYVYNNITCSATGEMVAIDLSSYASQSIAVAFYGESTVSNADNDLHIDNVSIDYIPACPQPLTLTTSNVAAHTATINWTAGGTETYWHVTLTDPYDTVVVDTMVNTPTYTFTGLTSETAYTASVTALCGTDESQASSVNFTTTIACPVPTGLAGVPTPHTISLSWTESGTATAWVVAYKAATATDFTEVNTTTNSYTLTGLTPETAYTVKVRANCGGDDGMSVWSATETVATLVACPAPILVSTGITDITAHNATVAWTGYEEHGSYVVMVGQPTIAMATTDFEDQVIPAFFTNDASYPWTVTAGGADGSGYCAIPGNQGVNGSTSDLICEVTGPCTVSFKAKVSSEEYYDYGHFLIDGEQQFGISGTYDWTEYSYPIGEGTHTLTWRYYKDGSSAGGSDLFYVDSITMPIPTVASWTEYTTSQQPYTLTGLAPETAYQVKVKGNCGTDGYSQASAPVAFTTDVACPAPTALTADDVTSSGATLSWNSSASAYNVRYREAALVDTLFYDNFENGLGQWTVYTEGETLSGQTDGWFIDSGISDTYPSGTHSCISYSYDNNSGAISADNWLVTPQVPLGGTLKFWVSTAASYPDTFEVRLSTTGNDTASFTVTLRPMSVALFGTSGDWFEVSIPLTGYTGNGYIAIHHVSYDGYVLLIDDFGIYGDTTPAGAWQNTTTTGSSIVLAGLEPSTAYEVQVQANCGDVDGESNWAMTTFTTSEFGAEANKWYAIASPKHDDGSIDEYESLANITNLLPTSAGAFAYDLFRYNEATSTWENQQNTVHTDFDVFEQARGYIYRRDNTAGITFVGTPNTGNISIDLTADADGDLHGFNLVGNPYYHTYTLNERCYSLTTDGSWEVHPTSYDLSIAEAVMVNTTTARTLTFTENTSSKGSHSAAPALAFTVKGGGLQDVAYASLTEGDGMPKLSHFNESAPVLSIPVNGRRYAIADLGTDCQTFDMTFRGIEGEYTLTLTANRSTLKYCHLIDRATGKDIDLLSNNSYTFTHSNTSTISDRFQVKLTPNVEESTTGNFAYWNGNAWVVEGTGTLEVYDVLGRLVKRADVNSQLSILNSQFPTTGVYVLRMGEKNQKIVVK